MDGLLEVVSNEQEELQRSNARCLELDNVVDSLRHNIDRSRKRCSRAKETRCHEIEKAVNRARTQFESAGTKQVKRPDGRIENWVRNLVVELVALDSVPTAKVPQVIERVRCNFAPKGDEHDDQARVDARKQTISDRSVRRIMVESYVKAFLRAAQLFSEAPCQCRGSCLTNKKLTCNSTKAWTASGDSTSYKGVGIGSHFSTFPPIPFKQDVVGVTPGIPFRQFLAATREVNHKTSTQLENWFNLFDYIVNTHNDSPAGKKKPITLDDVVRKLTGYLGDHAPDQKKLGKEFYRQKREVVVRSHGKEAMLSKPLEEVEEVMTTKFLEALNGMGGWESWEKLPLKDQLQFLEHLVEETRCHFGELALAALPESERRLELLFAESWCAMHKELNIFKAGAVRLEKFWKEEGLDGPVKLLSREQEEILSAVDDSEAGDDVDRASGGAVKLTSLVGALVNNKDEGKGCSEEFRTYTYDRLGKSSTLAETSKSRYQCYGDAAVAIMQHPDLYADFIDQHGMKKKRAAGPNHMEANILKGLRDPATMTEVAVLALYHESVSKPYAMQVRGVINEQKNSLDLGPLHRDLEAHCNTIIDNPGLLTGDTVSHATGAFYRTPWDQDVVNNILSRRQQLPHLDRALVAFFKGVRDKLPAFTEEFAPGSDVSQLTAQEKALAFRSPTNDHSEGSGAMHKQWSRRAPNMTTQQKNARMQVQLNGPGFLEFSHSLDEESQAFTRHKARELDAAKLPSKERRKQATADKEAVEEERRGAEKRAKLREEAKAREWALVEGFEPILDLNKFRSLPPREPPNKNLQQQLVWHRIVDGDESLPPGCFTNVAKEKMKELVLGALIRRGNKADIKADVVMADGERPKFFISGSIIDQLRTVGASLPTDELEAELELTDKIGLSLSHTKCANQPPPVPVHSYTLTSPTSSFHIPGFGCQWDPVDYSCSYDCIITAFAWMYSHGTEHWRATWAGESAAAKILSRRFKIILRAIEGPANDPVSVLFSRSRDAFRDVLSEENPRMFKRHGPVFASLVDILHSLSLRETTSQYFTFVATCSGRNCTPGLITPTGAPYILTPNVWASITGSENQPYHESLQEWVVRWFDWKASSSRRRPCMWCHTDRVLTRSFVKPPWIWFELFFGHPHVVLPSFVLSFSSYTYRLAAAMYGNGRHFVAHLSTPSGTWWHYDGKANGGQPIAVSIAHEEDLLTCGGSYTLNALVYCLAS